MPYFASSRSRPLVLVLILGFATACQSAHAAPVCTSLSVKKRLERVFANPKFKTMKLAWGVSVIELESAKEVFTHDPDRDLSPASTLKLLTAATALRRLGPEYTFTTDVLTHGKLSSGILEGDLYLKGGGDPSFVTERLELLAIEVQRAGLKRVKGHVFVDESEFEPAELQSTRRSSESDRAFNAPVSGLSFNYNSFRANFYPPAKRGGKSRVDIIPDIGWVKTALWKKPDPRWSIHGVTARRVSSDGFDLLEFANIAAVGTKARPRSFSVSSPALYAGRAFVEALERRGVHFASSAIKLKNAPSDASTLVQFEGLPLREIVILMNKYSNNMIADTLVKSLGKERSGAPGTLASGLESMRESAVKWGWKAGSFQLRSGSGLDRGNQVTARQLTSLIRNVVQDYSLAPEFLASLPIAGKDGTLRKKRWDLPEGAIVRAKGGSLDGVASLAGLASDGAGHTFIFSVIVNHPEAKPVDVHFWQEPLIEALLGSC